MIDIRDPTKNRWNDQRIKISYSLFIEDELHENELDLDNASARQ